MFEVENEQVGREFDELLESFNNVSFKDVLDILGGNVITKDGVERLRKELKESDKDDDIII